ncbi:tetratricopeptide repeat-containing sensor histidine kinase [Flavobacterium sp.]|uniref:tetratricopeptide repeat-containing sensor histidine kinase n=1 Tax=Flavobacterium sp. TaxID=239 RepID=UPI003B9BB406
MNKRLFFSLLFSFVVLFSLAQSRQIDSMLRNLNAGTAKERFKNLVRISDAYTQTDYNKSIQYARTAVAYAQKVNDKNYEGEAYNVLANGFQFHGKLDSALIYHQKSLAARKAAGTKKEIADSYNNLGVAYDTSGKYRQALTYYFKALQIFEDIDAIPQVAMTCTNIGIVYKEMKDYTKALKYYNKSYLLYQKTTDDFGKTVSAGNMGSILINFNRYKESLSYSKQAFAGYQKLGYETYTAYPLSNIAVVYDSMHVYEEAEKSYRKSVQLHQKFENTFEIANISVAFANCLYKQGKLNEAIARAHYAEQIATKAEQFLLVVKAYEILAKAYRKSSDYKNASLYAEKYAAGRDHLFEYEKTKASFELETVYETAKKERELLAQQAKTERRNITIIALSAIAFLSIAVGFLFYRQQKIKNRQQLQSFELQTALQQIETQKRLQEQRESISRDLHDNIGAQLTFIISSVNNIGFAFKNSDEKILRKLKSVSDFTKSTIVELRDTIWAMNESHISFDQLKLRILNFVEKAREMSQVSFNFSIDENLKARTFTAIQGMNVYRIIQEAVNNSLKYADAKSIDVSVSQDDTHLTICISDDGKGFDTDEITLGNGLLNMEKRAGELSGTFEITRKNQGTELRVRFPKTQLL